MCIRKWLGYWKDRRVQFFNFFLFAICPRSYGIYQGWPIVHNMNYFDRNLTIFLFTHSHICLNRGVHTCCMRVFYIIKGTMGRIPKFKWLYLEACCRQINISLLIFFLVFFIFINDFLFFHTTQIKFESFRNISNGCIRNGEIIDDIECHSSHDIFCCFNYEKKNTSYLNMKIN